MTHSFAHAPATEAQRVTPASVAAIAGRAEQAGRAWQAAPRPTEPDFVGLAADDSPDLESWTRPHDHRDLRLWFRLLSYCRLIETEIRSRLRSEFATTMPRFDMMAQLLRVPKGMKMSDLSRHMMVTNGNITGIADQLEKDGLIERIKVESDRRSCLIRLTPSGRKTFVKMASAHEQWTHELFTGIPERYRRQLFDMLGELKLAIRPRLPNRL